MGVVLPFTPRAKKQTPSVAGLVPEANAAEQAVLAAAGRGGNRYDVLDAATELLAVCRDRYGFTVMQDGLPREANALASALVALLRGLTLLDAGPSGRVLAGVRVYLGGSDLGWISDSTGGRTTLIVPNDAEPNRLAEFVRPRLIGYGV